MLYNRNYKKRLMFRVTYIYNKSQFVTLLQYYIIIVECSMTICCSNKHLQKY